MADNSGHLNKYPENLDPHYMQDLHWPPHHIVQTLCVSCSLRYASEVHHYRLYKYLVQSAGPQHTNILFYLFEENRMCSHRRNAVSDPLEP